MTRTTIDFFDTASEAAASAASLHRVGLRQGDVGALWSGIDSSAPDISFAAHATGQRIDTSDLGSLGVSGWLAQSTRATDSQSGLRPTLATILAPTALSSETLARVSDTLRSGGGIVVVRATGDMGAP